jgi:hypothetical protein
MFGMYHLVGLDQPFPASHWSGAVLTATSRPADSIALLVPLLTAANAGAWTHEEDQGASLSHPLDTGSDLNRSRPRRHRRPNRKIIPVSAITPTRASPALLAWIVQESRNRR